MEKQIVLDYKSITREYIETTLKENKDTASFECLVPVGDKESENLLNEYGFRYAGMRRVNSELYIVKALFIKNGTYEDMALFFDRRANDYDEHMKYWKLSKFLEVTENISSTTSKPRILDLGCGTGGEIEYILKRNPTAQITCVDLSKTMLDILQENYKGKLSNIKIVQSSYTEMDFKSGYYNYVIACSTLHHLTKEVKLELYKKVHGCLADDGCLLVTDYCVDEDEETKRLDNYQQMLKKGEIEKDKYYHMDLMLSFGSESELLKNAGFKELNFKIYDENIFVAVAKK